MTFIAPGRPPAFLAAAHFRQMGLMAADHRLWVGVNTRMEGWERLSRPPKAELPAERCGFGVALG